MSAKTYRIAITQGEPGGCGPDLCVEILHALEQAPLQVELVYVGDVRLLQERAERLNKPVTLTPFAPHSPPVSHAIGRCAAMDIPLPQPAPVGSADPANQPQVLAALQAAVAGCLAGQLDAVITGPVHKAAVHRAGIAFTGQTEFIADLCGVAGPLMTFVARDLKVALATTHIPLSQVPQAITTPLLLERLHTFKSGLRQYFQLADPMLLVCGLNPHAGEEGFLGDEEQRVILPALQQAEADGIRLRGPVAADTAFTPQSLAGADAVLCMYHDQALPVIKHRYFAEAVNLTLGLPFVRTSPDHGTALMLAGSGQIDASSSLSAVHLAARMLSQRAI